MKFFFLPVGLIWFASVAQAQVLPVPGGNNPDWILEKTESYAHSQQPEPPSGKSSPMPNVASAQTTTADRMTNKLPKSILSIGNRHSYWDAARQVGYEWESRPDSMAPVGVLTVREEQTGKVYAYRRKAVSDATPSPQQPPQPGKSIK